MNSSTPARSGFWELASRAGRILVTILARPAQALGNLVSLPWRGLAKAVPATAAAALVLGLAAWWFAHDAQVRQASELHQLRKQTAADVAALRNQAAAAVREANAHAQAIRDLEARRRQLDQAAEELRNHLASLQQQERTQVDRVAALPTSEVAIRVATRLGLEEQELGTRGQGLAVKPENSSSLNPNPQSLNPIPEAALRKIETTFVELDACREQATVKDQQFANCREQGGANAAVIGQQAASIENLKQALAVKDQILTRREADYKAELKAARGTWASRLARALKYIGLGVALGKVMR